MGNAVSDSARRALKDAKNIHMPQFTGAADISSLLSLNTSREFVKSLPLLTVKDGHYTSRYASG